LQRARSAPSVHLRGTPLGVGDCDRDPPAGTFLAHGAFEKLQEVPMENA
jgi:hypothetical protein